IGLGWQLRTAGPGPAQAPAVATAPAPPRHPLVIVADAMTREYLRALRAVPPPPPGAPGYDSRPGPDARAAPGRDPAAEAPDAAFLVQRLQHIPARRLALTRQLADA